jgi:hypothetical protein
MQVKAFVERPNGIYEFTTELNTEQCQFLLQYALRDLLTRGLLPFASPEVQEQYNMDATNGDSEPSGKPN